MYKKCEDCEVSYSEEIMELLTEICQGCNGSGEGYTDGSRCQVCKGKGVHEFGYYCEGCADNQEDKSKEDLLSFRTEIQNMFSHYIRS